MDDREFNEFCAKVDQRLVCQVCKEPIGEVHRSWCSVGFDTVQPYPYYLDLVAMLRVAKALPASIRLVIFLDGSAEVAIQTARHEWTIKEGEDETQAVRKALEAVAEEERSWS